MVNVTLGTVPQPRRKRRRIERRTRTREELMSLRIQGRAFRDENLILAL
jgi:hypothetical protein